MAENKENVLKNTTSGMGIRNKLLLWFLLIALIPLAVIGLASYKLSSKALEKQSFDSLESTLVLQKKSLEDYFSERTRNLENLAGDVQMLQQQTFATMSAVRDLKKEQVEDFFANRLRDVRVFAGSVPQQEALTGFAGKGQAMGKKYLSSINAWASERNFSSIMMVSPNGRIVFSSDPVVKTGVSLRKHEGSPEFDAFTIGSKGVGFTDFSQSELRNSEPAAYFSAPVTKGNTLLGVVLCQLDSDSLDKIMNKSIGLGESGESYLVGRDRLFRSNSTFFDEKTLASPAFLVDTESVEAAIAGQSGTGVIINYRGEYVLSSYVPVKVAGVDWALLVELDLSAAMTPKRQGGERDYLAEYAYNYGYPDLYLLDPDGYIYYSAKQLDDYQTNILSGPFSKSGLADTVSKVLETKKMVVSDYSRYQAAGNKPSAFLAMPLLQDETVVMIVALQIPIDQISAIMKEHGGQGDTYLVGADKLWRSESLQPEKYSVKSTLLNEKVKLDTEPVREALAGTGGTGITENGLGDKVLSSWKPFSFSGLHWAIISEIDKQEIDKPVNRLFKMLSMLAAATLFAAFLISVLVSGGITRQIRAIMNVIAKVEEGDYEARAKVVSTDELGTMASSFNGMIGTTHNLITTRQQENDQLQESIMGLLMEISDLADGDLTVRATVHEDATGTVADSLNMMLEELSSAIGNIKRSSEKVGDTANQLSSSTDVLAARSDEQSELITNSVEEIKQMTVAIEQAAEKAKQSAESSELSCDAALEGTRVVEDTSQAMDAIRGNVQDTARAIKRLGESSQEISDFAKTINEISDRTSILALNASIQASAAGEEGRGFAVVAEEIQRLAERAAGSTRQIETLIKNILNDITEAGSSMDASIQEVVQGTSLSENALTKLQDISNRSSEVAVLIDEVSRATSEQAQAAVKVAGAMGEVGVISTDTAEETRATSSKMKGMADVADKMLKSVAIFKLPEDGDTAADSAGSDDVQDVSVAPEDEQVG